MPTVFENLSDGFYTAFFESDSEKRKTAIESWVKSVVPVLQEAVENDIRAYLEPILKDTWTPAGWMSRAQKFNGPYIDRAFIDTYKLYLDIKLRPHHPREKDVIVGALSPEIRANTLNAAKKAMPDIKSIQNKLDVKMAPSINNDDDDSDNYNEGHSSNDDRSNSMNPNNDSYDASMDNRSDQMNPNNDAYWSSRGR